MREGERGPGARLPFGGILLLKAGLWFEDVDKPPRVTTFYRFCLRKRVKRI